MKCSFTRTSIVTASGLLALGGLCWGEPAPLNIEPSGADDSDVKKEATRRNGIDLVRRAAGSQAASAARWVDRFFEDPDYREEEADARISLRQSIKFSQESDPEYRTRISGSLSLPQFSRKWKVVFEGNDDVEIDDEDEAGIEASADESVDTPTVGLQYVSVTSPEYDFRIGAGVRISGASAYIGPRWRFQTNVSPLWRTRFTQRLRWYSDDEWRSNTDIDVDRRIGTRNLFRQNFSTDWREARFDEEGFRHSATTSLFQPLADTRALSYAWSSDYLTRPTERWSSSTLSISYRSRLFQDWIFLEMRPFVSWEEELDWNSNPGVAVSLSFIIEDEKLTPQPHIR